MINVYLIISLILEICRSLLKKKKYVTQYILKRITKLQFCFLKIEKIQTEKVFVECIYDDSQKLLKKMNATYTLHY